MKNWKTTCILAMPGLKIDCYYIKQQNHHPLKFQAYSVLLLDRKTKQNKLTRHVKTVHMKVTLYTNFESDGKRWRETGLF